MKRIGLDELKRLQLDILLDVHNFCINNSIDYFITAGTLIGAIRHKGYIPWDDDIDICMTRPNYDKFLKLFNGTYSNLQVLAPELNWEFYAPYANVCDTRTRLEEGRNGHRGIEVGVKIDVFPVDGVPNNLRAFLSQTEQVFRYNKIMRTKRFRMPSKLSASWFAYVIKKILYLPYSYSSLQKRIYSQAIRTDYSISDLAGNITFDPIVFRAPRYIFDEYIDIVFEGHVFKTIRYYDLYLRLMYGNYMQLPPIEQRVSHHDFEAYWKD